MSVVDRVTRIVRDQLGLHEDLVVMDESSFADDLGADSLDHVEVVMVVEDEFGIEIPSADAESLKTVGTLVAYVERAILAKADR